MIDNRFLIFISENLSSFFLLVGYSGYTAWPYSLHSVQTQKSKKSEAISPEQHAYSCLGADVLSPSFTYKILTKDQIIPQQTS